MNKRSNGEGTISKRADGRFMFRWTDQDGRRRTGYAKSAQEASRALRDALRRVEEGVPAVESADTFRAVAEEWRRTAMVRQGIQPNSLRTYSSALRTHAYPVIGDKRMRDLRPAHVAEVLGRMQDAGLSAAYRGVAWKAMSNVCQTAVTDGLLRRNPVHLVKAPSAERTTKVVPSREQVAAMIDAAPTPRARALVVVLAHTGLRIGEALSLRWSDWDGEGTMRVLDTKGGRPRAVPVTTRLADELRTWRRAQAEERLASVWWSDEDWILSTSIGTRWDEGNARKHVFRPLVNGDPESGVPGICPGATPHSLRHAAATILLEEGVPMKVVSELLGHSSTKVTAETYSHVTARLVAEAGAAIERALG